MVVARIYASSVVCANDEYDSEGTDDTDDDDNNGAEDKEE